MESWRSFAERIGGGRRGLGLVRLALMALGLMPALCFLVLGYIAFYLAASHLGSGELLITVVVAAAQILCLISGIFSAISAFYFGRDLPYLIPLPIRPGEIALSKFFRILIGEYITIAPMVVPALAVYGVMADVSWTFLPFAVIIFLLMPVVPLSLAALFSLVLMRTINLRRKRDGLRAVALLFTVAVAVVFGQWAGQFGSFRVQPEQVEQVQQFLVARQGLAAGLARAMPTSYWATEALRAGAPALGAGGLFLYVGVSALAVALLMGFAERLFVYELPDAGVAGKARSLTDRELISGTGRVHSPLGALVLREIRLVNRTPTFLMGAVLPGVMVVVVTLIPLLRDSDFRELVRELSGPAVTYGTPAVALGAMFFISSTSLLASTAISREGRTFWILRSLPVAPALQIRAKVLYSVLVNLLSSMAVVAVVLRWLRLLGPLTFLYLLVAGTLATAAGSYLMMIPDILRPNFSWTDPRQLTSKFNSLFSMILMMGVIGVLTPVSVLLYRADERLVLPALLLIFGLLTWGLDRAVTRLAEQKYPEYED